MKLVFYGGGDADENALLDELTLSLTKKKSPKITYIPSCSYGSEQDFIEFVEQFDKFRLTRFIYFPIDIPFDKILLKEVLSSDVIHLSGGNTYYFLKYLKKSGMHKHLKQFVKNGGVLTGLSAGGIIMTPNIHTAGFPIFDKDDNDENVKNLNSLNLVRFEFFPHYKNSRRYDRELFERSKNTELPLYACPDGSGIVVEKDSIRFCGRAYCFYKGKKINIYSKVLKAS